VCLVDHHDDDGDGVVPEAADEEVGDGGVVLELADVGEKDGFGVFGLAFLEVHVVSCAVDE